MSFPLFRSSSLSFSVVLWFSVHTSRASLVTFVPQYFVLSDAIVNGRGFLILPSDCFFLWKGSLSSLSFWLITIS